jgi:Mg-chelatase subunit ChlI
MGLFTGILLLPLAPVRGAVKLAEVIQRQVEQELNNPARTRAQLEELEEKRERGEISHEEEHEAQKAILETKIAPKAVEEQLDPAEKQAGEQSSGGQRRPTARKSTRKSPASVRRRPRRSR